MEIMQFATQPTMGRMHSVDTSLNSHSIQVERKHITFDLKENPRGRFLRIIEEVGGRRDAVIVPVSGLDEFRDALDKVIEYNKTLPPQP